MARIRITSNGRDNDNYKAYIATTGKTGTISKHYCSERAQKEVTRYGFAYVNQPQERIV